MFADETTLRFLNHFQLFLDVEDKCIKFFIKFSVKQVNVLTSTLGSKSVQRNFLDFLKNFQKGLRQIMVNILHLA